MDTTASELALAVRERAISDRGALPRHPWATPLMDGVEALVTMSGEWLATMLPDMSSGTSQSAPSHWTGSPLASFSAP